MPKLMSLSLKVLKQIAVDYDLPDAGTKAALIDIITEETGSDEIDPNVLKSILQKPNVDINTQVEKLTGLVQTMAEQLNGLTSTRRNNEEGNSDSPDNASAELLADDNDRERSCANMSPVLSERCVNVRARVSTNERCVEPKASTQDISKILPDFDPINGSLSAEQFINKINGMTVTYNWSKDVVLFAAQGKLKGHAKIWLDAQPVFETYDDFCLALLTDFPYIVSSADIHIEMIKRTQSRNETVVEYFYTMLALGRKGRLDDRSIIQHTINGISDEYLKRMLKTLTIKTCPELFAALKENVHHAPPSDKHRKQLEKHHSIKTTEPTETTRKSVTCYNCNKSGHIAVNCPDPQKKPRCQVCKKTNHTSANCPNEKPNVHAVEDDGKCKLIKDIIVNGVAVKGFVDPGSSRTLIKSSLAYTLAQTTPCQIALKGFAGGKYECVEQVKLTLKMDKGIFEITMLVVDDKLLAEDVLIGRDTLCQNGHRLIIENGNCHVQNTTEVQNIESNVDPNVNNLIERYQDVFANKLSELGICSKVKMNIELTATTPIQLKPYRVPFAKRTIITKIINELLEHQIIRPSTSDYASPTVLVTKKNGESRLCVDYRMLNKITKKIPFPMPLIDEQFAQLAGNKFYSTLDLRMGYHQVAICEESRKYLVVKAVRNTKTTPVINVLNELSSYFGLPIKITTDRGTAYTSKMFEDYCKNNFIRHVKNAVKTPRANGQVERANRMILEYLRSTVTNAKDWDTYLRELQWTINTQKNSTTGFTPNQLLFDFNPRDIIKNALTAALEPVEPPDDTPISIRRQKALENMNGAREKWKQRFDKVHATPRVYQKDDLVVIHNEPPSTGESRKLEPKFKGPYQITRVLDNDRYVIESIPGTRCGKRKFCSVFTTDKIKPWCSDLPDMIDTDDITPEQADSEDEVVSQERPNCNTLV